MNKKEPVLDKRPSHPYDYKEMTWGKFIRLRKWAKKLADEVGYPVYLVGSTLTKVIPRDFDVSVIIPLNEYEKMYGVQPDTQEGYCKYMNNVFNKNVKYYFEGRELLDENDEASFDLKFCPDTWFTEKDKLLLAEPKYN